MGRLRREPWQGATPRLDAVRYAYTDRFRFKSDKAATELGYTVSPLEPALRDAITWFRSNGVL